MRISDVNMLRVSAHLPLPADCLQRAKAFARTEVGGPPLRPQGGPLSAFLGAGMVVESLGLVLLFRAHRMAPGDRRQ